MRLSATRLTSIAQAGGGRTLIQRAIAILRRFGTDAHVYLPGVGMLNGLQAANYIDSAGTQAGAVDQPVGLVLDAGGGLGANLFPGGIFSNGIASANYVARGTKSFELGSLRITTTELNASFGVVTAISLGTIVNNALITIKVKSVSKASPSHSLGFYLSAGQNSGVSAAGVSTNGPGEYQFFIPNTTLTYLTARSEYGVPNIGDTWDIESVTVREVTGIHATQPTTASKPILRRGAVNQLLWSGDFTNSAWTLVGTASKVGSTLSMPSLNDAVFHTTTAAAAASTGVVMLSGTGSLSLWLFNSTDFAIGLKQITLTSEPTLYFVNATPTVAGSTLRFGRRTGDTATSVTFQSAALFAGTYTAAQIQALGGIPLTTTAPASTALGPQYWQFDGGNDSLSLGGPLFQMADDHCVVAGLNCANDAAARVVFSNYGSATPAYAAQIYQASGTVTVEWRDDAGVFGSPATPQTLVAGSTAVISARRIGNTATSRKNGANPLSATVALGASTLNSAAIGSNRFGNFMNGNIYPVMAIKGTVTDPDLLLLEKLVGQMSGVQI